MTTQATSREVQIGDRVFKSGAEAIRFFDGIRESIAPGGHVSGEHEKDVMALYLRHPDVAKKAVSGVCYFIVGKAKGGTTCFYAVGRDERKVDFSVFHAVYGKPKQR